MVVALFCESVGRTLDTGIEVLRDRNGPRGEKRRPELEAKSDDDEDDGSPQINATKTRVESSQSVGRESCVFLKVV